MTETTQMPAVVIYAALSKASDDPDQASIETQVVAVRARLAQPDRAGADVIGEFTDDGYSGSKGNRGPGLQAAIDLAVRAADERGSCELWANTSARFGRGSGLRDGARAIGALFYDLRAKGVTLRTVADDELVSTEMLVGIGSSIAAKYSADLSESVKRAKQRQLASGDHLGGPICDGYRIVHDADGRSLRLDPDRMAIVRSIFDLAAEGVPDAQIARRLNAQGTRTRNGRPFDRRAIQNTATNPFYAGRVAYKRGTPDEQIVPGKHPPLVDPAVFDRIQVMRVARDHAPGRKVVGRPAQNHALARLAVCGRCGERLYAQTSSYRRKDGSRARTYVCQNYANSTGLCDAKPINAEVVDSAVIAGLDTLLVDFDGWRSRILDGHAAERGRLKNEVDRAQRDRDAQAARAEKIRAKWAGYVAADDDSADLVLPTVKREAQAVLEAERRLAAATDALASVPEDAPADAMLDFANELRTAISGRIDKTGTVAEINQALREMFKCFVVHERDGTRLPDGTPHPFDPTGIVIFPWLRLGVIAPPSDPELGWAWPRVVGPEDDPPPLRWLTPPTDPEPAENLSHTQA